MKENTIISDDEIVKRINKNESLGINLLSRKYSKKLRGKIYIRLSHYFRLDLFDDIQQDIWEDIYKSIVEDKFVSDGENLLPYINKIFIHNFYKHYYDYCIKKTSNVTDEEELAILYYRNDDQTLEEQISRSDKIYKCFKTLSTKERTVINLFLFEGLKPEQIARKLNISYSTVRGQFRTAIKKIKNKIKYMDKE